MTIHPFNLIQHVTLSSLILFMDDAELLVQSRLFKAYELDITKQGFAYET